MVSKLIERMTMYLNKPNQHVQYWYWFYLCLILQRHFTVSGLSIYTTNSKSTEHRPFYQETISDQ